MDISQQRNSLLVRQDHSDDPRWVDTVMSYAQTVNKVFSRNTCRLCHLYSDQQVEYESRLVDKQISPVERAYLKAAATHQTVLRPEVEFYRQFLFDEASVVEAISHRTADEGAMDA